MEGELDVADVGGLVIGECAEGDVSAEASAKEGRAGDAGEVFGAAAGGVIGVRVGDDGARDGSPGIDVESAGTAEGAVFSEFDERGQGRHEGV